VRGNGEKKYRQMQTAEKKSNRCRKETLEDIAKPTITELRISNRKFISMANLMHEYTTTTVFVNDAIFYKV
jgi:hypothetical protein